MSAHRPEGTTAAPTAPTASSGPTSSTGRWSSLRPLAFDLGLPFGTYFLALHVAGASMLTALIASGVVALARTVYSTVRERAISAMSALVLSVNAAGVVLSFVSGSVRVVSAKDAAISSVVGLGILFSVWRGRPALASALRPFITKGDAARDAAWDRLDGDARFLRLVNRYTVIFGAAFVLDCAVRIGCAVAAPLSVLGWIGTAATLGAVVVSCVVGGGLTVEPLTALVDAEAARA